MVQTKKPKVTLVGAGPGDPELITLKGWKALQSADVVLYDALSSAELLEIAPGQALKVYVGKRANKHRYRQEEINEMLVELALKHGHVVRLKGGDPFVFGRGHEELSYVSSHQVPIQVIPGISSCISVPELQQVPVTRRGINESFWVLTGTTRQGTLSEDVALAAQSNATSIILMGIRKIREITTLFAEHGKGSIPAMVVQNGSLAGERSVLANVDQLADRVEEENIGSPGIIVIGKVVGLHPEWAVAQISDQLITLQTTQHAYSRA